MAHGGTKFGQSAKPHETYGKEIKCVRVSERASGRKCLCVWDRHELWRRAEQWQEALMTQPSLERQQSEKGEGGRERRGGKQQTNRLTNMGVPQTTNTPKSNQI